MDGSGVGEDASIASLYGRVVGVGMNEAELGLNPVLSEYIVQVSLSTGGRHCTHTSLSTTGLLEYS